MLKLNPNPTFEAEVRVTVPGQAEPATVTLTFKYMSRSALSEFYKGAEGKSDAEALRDVVVGWSGIDAPFSTDALATFLDNYPAAASEIFAGFHRALFESRVKN